MKNYHFFISCVGCEGQILKSLNTMIRKSRKISYHTFLDKVPLKEIRDLFPQYKYNGGGLHIKDDWSVSWHKSKWNGKTCYYIRHSAIEYVFINPDNYE